MPSLVDRFINRAVNTERYISGLTNTAIPHLNKLREDINILILSHPDDVEKSIPRIEKAIDKAFDKILRLIEGESEDFVEDELEWLDGIADEFKENSK